MFNRARLVFAVVACLLPAAAGAQPPLGSGGRGSFPGCPKCGVWSWVDYPVVDRTPGDDLLGIQPDPRIRKAVSTANFQVQGWGFECVSGRAVDRVDVWYQDYDGINRPVKVIPSQSRYGFIARPDVVAFGVAIGCPNVVMNTGWAVAVAGVPPGLRLITINVWRGPYVETHQRIYLVKP